MADAAMSNRPNGYPSRAPRPVFVVGVVLLLMLLGGARAIARLATDYLWFDEVGYTSTWTSMVLGRVGLGAVFTLIFGALCVLTVLAAARLAPPSLLFDPGEEVVEQIREIVRQRPLVTVGGFSAVMALLVGPTMSAQWSDWVLFRHGSAQPGAFPGIENVFGKDPSFFLFRLPFLSALAAWTFTALFLLLLIAAFAHVIYGGLRVATVPIRVTTAAKAHFSVLLALMTLTKAISYVLNRYQLALGTNGVVRGAGYTDIKARAPGLLLLVLVSVLASGLLLASLRRSSWRLPAVGLALWVVTSLIVTGIYPSVLGRIVKSSEQTRERPSIERNIASTRFAFGLDQIESKTLGLADEQDRKVAVPTGPASKASIENTRLWEPTADIAGNVFTSLQQVTSFYRFADVDFDRYEINGRLTPVVVSARELDEDFNELSSWVKRRLTYTHGYGLVIADATAADEDGRPKFLTKDLPPVGLIQPKEPRIYFGEATNGYAIVGTKTPEVDFTAESQQKTSTYAGKGGVTVGGLFRKVLFALRFGDPNIVLSGEITPKSKVLIRRNVLERVRAIAPFLTYDSDPYPVVSNDRLVWVVDGYTTSNQFPSSQTARINGFLQSSNGLYRTYNYVRNSVKVVVDAYDGTTRFYRLDSESKRADPIAASFASAFPKLFRGNTALDRDYPGLRAHFRYPEELFRVQSAMLAQYHVDNPDELYANTNRWDVSKNPGDAPERDEADTVSVPLGTVPDGSATRMRPYYALAQFPGERAPAFRIQSHFVPFSADRKQQNLRAILLGDSDPGSYGKLTLLTVPSDQQVSGPSLIANKFSSNNTISERESLLGRGGSVLRYGNTQVLPLGNSLLFVRPMFVSASQSKLPLLSFVSVAWQSKIGFAPTLPEALRQVGLGQLVGDVAPSSAASTPAPGSSTGKGTDAETTVEGALSKVADLLEEAQASLDKADLDGYQRNVDAARDLLAGLRVRGLLNDGAPSGVAASTVPNTATSVAPAAKVD